jgi:hypothetical protein
LIPTRWLKKLMVEAELTPITEHIVACRDPTDDKFLELAVNGRADVIATGRLRAPGAWKRGRGRERPDGSLFK